MDLSKIKTVIILGSVWYNRLNDPDANFKEVLGRLEKDSLVNE